MVGASHQVSPSRTLMRVWVSIPASAAIERFDLSAQASLSPPGDRHDELRFGLDGLLERSFGPGSSFL